MDTLSFISRYEAILKLKAIPKATFYKACGITDAAVSQWRKKKTKPAMTTISRIAEYLDVSVVDLLNDESAYPEAVSKDMCRDISNALRHNHTGITFFVPAAIKKEIDEGTYLFNNITYQQFSALTGKPAEAYFDTTDNKKSSAPEGAEPRSAKERALESIKEVASTEDLLEILSAITEQLKK